MKTEHILVIRFSALGDVAMTVPVVAALAQQYPNVRVTMLSRPQARPLFEHLAANVGFMEADFKNEYRGVRGLNALYRRLTAKQFTAIADLHDVIRSQFLRMRFNLDRFHVAHIDKHRALRKLLTRDQDKVMEPLPTAFENYAEVFAKLGYPVKLHPGGEIEKTDIIESIGGTRLTGQRPLIGIAPFAAHRGKTWPIESMAKVISRLLAAHPYCRIFLFGGGDHEPEQLRALAARCQGNVTVVPDHMDGLEQELALMQQLDVMVTMDSANMHLASLVSTPVVSIWGATHPYAGFMGWGQSADNAIGIDMPCRPCSIFGNKPCRRGDYACLTGITPEMVTEKVENVLKSRGKAVDKP